MARILLYLVVLQELQAVQSRIHFQIQAFQQVAGLLEVTTQTALKSRIQWQPHVHSFLPYLQAAAQVRFGIRLSALQHFHRAQAQLENRQQT